MHAQASKGLHRERLATAHSVVQRHASWATGVGLIPIPIADVVGLGGILVKMLDTLEECLPFEMPPPPWEGA